MHHTTRLHLGPHRASGKPERLLRASVTAFCSIPRPTRRETTQLDDLAVPLLASASDDTLRFVAAALSDSPHAPPTLIRRLAEQSLDISAPVLMRSPVLTNIDLVALIGRHGLAHARAIAARNDLDERIARLIRSIGAIDDMAAAPPPHGEAERSDAAVATPAGKARDYLRSVMLPAGDLADAHPAAPIELRLEGDPGVCRKLRSTALSGIPALFHTALADALGIGLERARAMSDGADASNLIVGLRHLCEAEEQALLIFQCVRPAQAGTARMIGAFLEAYNAVTPHDAARIVETWRQVDAGPAADASRGGPRHGEAANQATATTRLRAS